MIDIDGSAGEGGGQILRTALSLSMCTGQPVRIDAIRARRPKPGLMRQHLACVTAAQAVCGATVEGAELGSARVVFRPGPIAAGAYTFAIGTAGSCLLVLQTVLPALLQAPGESRLTLTGGTHNPMAPSFHFIDRCFAPLLRRTGAGLSLRLVRHGFYPAGGGEVQARITPAEGGLQPFDLLARGERAGADAECLVPGLSPRIAERELALLARALGWTEAQLQTPAINRGEGPGNALIATLRHEHVTEVVTAIGAKGRSAEQVAQEAIDALRAYGASTAAAGPHLADQLALPLALAVHHTRRPASYTCTEVTEHTRTNLETIRQFLPLQASVDLTGGHWTVRLAPGA